MFKATLFLAATGALAPALHAQGADDQESLDARVKRLEREVRELQSQQPAAPEAPASGRDLRAFWDDGLRFESADRRIKLRFGGFMQADAIAGGGYPALDAAVGDFEDGAEIRRARILMNGTIDDQFAFRFMYDFADSNKVKISDLFGEVQKIPVVGKLRVGQFWEPMSFEQLTFDIDADFMERSLMNSLSPARNVGAAVHDDYGGRFTWWLGAFVDDGSNDPGIAQSDGDHAVTARVAGLPIDSSDDSTFLHVGASASYRTPTAGTVAYSARPESRLAPVFATTGTLTEVDRVLLLGGEVAAQSGPFHVSAEYLESLLDSSANGDPRFPGWYVAGGWFITGEHLSYVHSDGVVGAPKVLHPYGTDGGFGALELVARYSVLDLDSGGVRGGTVEDTIVGVNWYLNRMFRVGVDGIHSRLEGVGDANFLQFWFQAIF
jgi:phosphate-selective porin OprO and OprP